MEAARCNACNPVIRHWHMRRPTQWQKADAGFRSVHFGEAEALAVWCPADDLGESPEAIEGFAKFVGYSALRGYEVDTPRARPGRRVITGNIRDPFAVGRIERRILG